jgi:hypothetical protein
MLFACLLFTLSSCSKSDDDDGAIPAGKKYPLENLEYRLTTQTAGSESIIVKYDIKNRSNTDYVRLDYDYNYHIRLKINIFATDGTKFEATPLVENLAKGATKADQWSIDYSAGKTIDLTKTSLEFIYKR